jgi:hypothetical protein
MQVRTAELNGEPIFTIMLPTGRTNGFLHSSGSERPGLTGSVATAPATAHGTPLVFAGRSEAVFAQIAIELAAK